MYKKSTALFLSFVLILSLVFTPTYAQTDESESDVTPNPTNESVTESLTEQITDLKEKIASRVAEMNLVEKRGIVGTVISVDGTQITLEDIYGNSRAIDVDEITEFDSDDADSSFGISDITEGMEISALGLFNKQSERILARFITVVSIPEYVQGTVVSTDEDEFTIEIITSSEETYTVDVETNTTTQELIEDEFENSGFSQIEETQMIFITGVSDEDDENRLTASSILLFPVETTDESEDEE